MSYTGGSPQDSIGKLFKSIFYVPQDQQCIYILFYSEDWIR